MRITYETELGDRGQMPFEQLRSKDRVMIDNDLEGVRKGSQGRVIAFDSQLGTVRVEVMRTGPEAGRTQINLPSTDVVVMLNSGDARVSSSRALSNNTRASVQTTAQAREAIFRNDEVEGPMITVAEISDEPLHSNIAKMIAPTIDFTKVTAETLRTLLRWASMRRDPTIKKAEPDLAEVRTTSEWLKGVAARSDDSGVQLVVRRTAALLDHYLTAEAPR